MIKNNEKELKNQLITCLEKFFKSGKSKRIIIIKDIQKLLHGILFSEYSRGLQYVMSQLMVINNYGAWHHTDEIYEELCNKSLFELKYKRL